MAENVTVQAEFSEEEWVVHFRAFKIATRMWHAVQRGDKERATAELEVLMELIGEVDPP